MAAAAAAAATLAGSFELCVTVVSVTVVLPVGIWLTVGGSVTAGLELSVADGLDEVGGVGTMEVPLGETGPPAFGSVGVCVGGVVVGGLLVGSIGGLDVVDGEESPTDGVVGVTVVGGTLLAATIVDAG